MLFKGCFASLMGCALLVGAGCAQGPQSQGTPEAVRSTQSADTGATWFDVVGVNATGNNLTKTGGAGWNAGAASNQSLSGDGTASFTTSEVTTDKLVGLSHADPVQNPGAIDFGLYLSSSGGIAIYEDGTLAGSFGNYAANDLFTIQVSGTHVSYLQNGNVLYTSANAPSLPLLVGATLYSTGATVNNVVFALPYWQDIVGVTASGQSLTKTGSTGWNAGAATVSTLAGDGSAQFTTAETTTDKLVGLSHTDPAQNPGAIDFGLYLSSSGGIAVYEDGTLAGSFGNYAANDLFKIQVSGTQVSYLRNGNVLYTSTNTPNPPLLVGATLYSTGATVNSVILSPVTPFWQDVVGVTTAGSSMTKTGSSGWNAGAATSATLASDGYAQFTTGETNTDKMGGLSHADPAQNFAAIDFAIYLTSSSGIAIYEDGSLAGSFGTYAAGDVFDIQLTGTQVTYLQNGNLLYTSTHTANLPLLFGTSLFTTGATINSVAVVPYWQDVVGVSTAGHSLTKTGAAGWNAGAATSATLTGNGYAQFSTAEATTDKLAGLSHTDPAQNISAIDFGIYLSSSGDISIYEDGTYAGSFGSYAAGDVFTIQVTGSQVTYLQNGNLLYTSTNPANLPLLFGAGLFTTGATIQNADLNTGTPSALAAAEQSFANSVASTHCTNQLNCCAAVDPGSYNEAACESAVAGFGWEANLPSDYGLFARGNIAFNSAKASSCLSALAGMPCGSQTAAQFAGITQACQLVLTGTIPAGQSGCLSSFECASDTYCAQPGGGGAGVCTPLATLGQPCDTSISSTLNPIPDFMCSYLGSADTGLYCDLIDPSSSPNYGTCQPLLANGANCTNATTSYFDDQACSVNVCGDTGCGTATSYPYSPWCASFAN